MALTPPTFMDFGTFRNETVAAGDQSYVTLMLQQATDAIWATTGIEDYPTDDRASRILRNAIMDFAQWLLSQSEHKDEINNPFSGERIGSYSYNKMQQARRGEETGIYWLDLLFQMLHTTSDASGAWSSSEYVFNPGGLTFAEQDFLEQLDRPFYYDPYGG